MTPNGRRLIFVLSVPLATQLGGVPAHAQFLTQGDVAALPAASADHRIHYGADKLQFGELRLPPGIGPFPTAVVIHGGCWLAQYADLSLYAPMADALRRMGIATWNVEYRSVDSPGGGWPGTFNDIGQAVDHLRELAKVHPIDLKRVITIGHSAGGHLALWAAARHRLPKTSALFSKDPLPLLGVLNLSGMGDLKAYSKERCGRSISRLVGGSPSEVPERYREGSPVEMLPLGARQIFIAGASDQTVRPEYAHDYAATARKSGDDVQVIVIDRVAHFEAIAPGSSAWSRVSEAALSFFVTVKSKDAPGAVQRPDLSR